MSCGSTWATYYDWEWRSALFPMFCKSRQCHIFFPVTSFTTTNYVPIVWNHILLLSWNAWGCLWKLPLCVSLPIQSRSENEPNARAHVSAMVLLIIKLQGSCYSFRYPSILLHEHNPLFRVVIRSLRALKPDSRPMPNKQKYFGES